MLKYFVLDDDDFWKAVDYSDINKIRLKIIDYFSEPMFKGTFEPSHLMPCLRNYCSDMRGAIEAGSLEIDVEFESNQKGILRIKFEETWHYGCKDIDGGDEVEAEMPFVLELKNRSIVLDICYNPERDTVDEF